VVPLTCEGAAAFLKAEVDADCDSAIANHYDLNPLGVNMGKYFVQGPGVLLEQGLFITDTDADQSFTFENAHFYKSAFSNAEDNEKYALVYDSVDFTRDRDETRFPATCPSIGEEFDAVPFDVDTTDYHVEAVLSGDIFTLGAYVPADENLMSDFIIRYFRPFGDTLEITLGVVVKFTDDTFTETETRFFYIDKDGDDTNKYDGVLLTSSGGKTVIPDVVDGAGHPVYTNGKFRLVL
jgi:hypothetical protein